MSAIAAVPEPPPGRSRLAALLEHFARIQDPRDVRRILHPLGEVLLHDRTSRLRKPHLRGEERRRDSTRPHR